MPTPISVDDEATWPAEVVALLEKHASSLRDRPSSPPEALLHAVGTHLEPHRLVTFHCTRLTEDELDDVRRKGLRPLSPELVQRKVEQQVHDGQLDRFYADEMLAHYRRIAPESDSRVGRIWAVLGASALKDEVGLSLPLLMWGGEAVRNLELPADVYSIGSACILELEVAVASLTARPGWALAEQFAFNRGWSDDDGADDACIRDPVEPSAIRRVVRFGEPDFEALTGCSTWRCQL